MGKLIGRRGRMELLVVHRLPPTPQLEAGHLMLHPLIPYAEVVSRGSASSVTGKK